MQRPATQGTRQREAATSSWREIERFSLHLRRAIAPLVDADAFALFVRDPHDSATIRPAAGAREPSYRIGEGMTGVVFARGYPWRVGRLWRQHRRDRARFELVVPGPWMAIPILAPPPRSDSQMFQDEVRVLGVIRLSRSRSAPSFTETEQRIVEILCAAAAPSLLALFAPAARRRPVPDDDALLDRLVEGIWTMIRRGSRPDALTARAVNVRALVDRLRALAVRTDFDRLAALARSADPHVAGLGLTLVRQIRRDPRTRRLLEKLWHGRCPAEVLHEVAWRLLDYEDLPEEMHWEIYRLATRHRRYFLDYALNWYGGSWDRLVESVRDRLRDPGFPAAKTWIYLMLVSGIPGRHRLRPVARCLAARWAKAEHAVTARVAAGILRRSRAGGRR